MTTTCEDAPCCGCCGTNIYGQYQGDTGYDYDQDDFYNDDDDNYGEADPSTCDHGDCSYYEQPGKYSAECDLCGTEGVVFPMMGVYVVRFPVTKVTESDYSIREDAAMESGLFGDC